MQQPQCPLVIETGRMLLSEDGEDILFQVSLETYGLSIGKTEDYESVESGIAHPLTFIS